jgi:hypothetical protein
MILIFVGCVICIAAIIGGIIIFIRRGRTSAKEKMLILIMPLPAAAVIMIVVWLVLMYHFHGTQLESRVDISPIKQLTQEQVELSEEVALQMLDHTSLRDVRALKGFEYRDAIGYTFWWDERRSSARELRINMIIFDDDIGAVEETSRLIPSQQFGYLGYQEIINDNNTGAVLRHCINNSSFSMAQRHLVSNVRVGNVVFHFFELRPIYGLSSGYSDQLIALFVKLLEEAYNAY